METKFSLRPQQRTSQILELEDDGLGMKYDFTVISADKADTSVEDSGDDNKVKPQTQTDNNANTGIEDDGDDNKIKP